MELIWPEKKRATSVRRNGEAEFFLEKKRRNYFALPKYDTAGMIEK
jgi:hypothetical protein